MSGKRVRRAQRRKGRPTVMDTHVLLELAVERRRLGDQRRKDLGDRIVESCAHVVLSGDQEDEAWPRLAEKGLRFAQQNPVLVQLDENQKLRILPRSAVKRFREKARVVFSRTRGRNVRDDVHLYEAAATCGDAMVVTRDEHLLRNAGALLRATGVETLEPEEF